MRCTRVSDSHVHKVNKRQASRCLNILGLRKKTKTLRMKVCIVVLLVLVAVVAATDVDKRLFLPSLSELVAKLKSLLVSHSTVTLGVCEAACGAVAELAAPLCAPACELVVKELSG
ncbi:uncharacterized protein LOC112564945 isoform X1 [Pomacea canaliculata]|uniref:uncharacterized protein LOC112564945 isoform X1 n=1 Tax=Pomacea canaliculata TaxID=400727 RepID=UPI000D738D10|nr:uncharacterized protein LOC112564945 isoform X1 [Pomacea canaliculata]